MYVISASHNSWGLTHDMSIYHEAWLCFYELRGQESGQQRSAKQVAIASEKHMTSQDGKPRYSKVESSHVKTISQNCSWWETKRNPCSKPTWPPKGPCLGGFWDPEGPQPHREVLLPHCSTWATYPSPENLGLL